MLKFDKKKHIAQNVRNWFLNQNYKFNIKFIAKRVLKQLIAIQLSLKDGERENKETLIKLAKRNIKNLIGLFDKSLKKRIYKKNAINKKKGKLGILLSFLIKNF